MFNVLINMEGCKHHLYKVFTKYYNCSNVFKINNITETLETVFGGYIVEIGVLTQTNTKF